MSPYQVLGPMLAKQASTQPSAILYFTALVLGSYGLSIFGSYGVLEYSRRVEGGARIFGSRIANTPPVTKPTAAPVAVPVATSEPAATTTFGAAGASAAAGIRKPKLLRTSSLEGQRGACSPSARCNPHPIWKPSSQELPMSSRALFVLQFVGFYSGTSKINTSAMALVSLGCRRERVRWSMATPNYAKHGSWAWHAS
jgi:hypothetical protein